MKINTSKDRNKAKLLQEIKIFQDRDQMDFLFEDKFHPTAWSHPNIEYFELSKSLYIPHKLHNAINYKHELSLIYTFNI